MCLCVEIFDREVVMKERALGSQRGARRVLKRGRG